MLNAYPAFQKAKMLRIILVGPVRMGIGIAIALLSGDGGYEVKLVALEEREVIPPRVPDYSLDKVFNNRYRGFIELLHPFKDSSVVHFYGFLRRR